MKRMVGSGQAVRGAVLVVLSLLGGTLLAAVPEVRRGGAPPPARSLEPGPTPGEMRGAIEQLMLDRLKEVLRLTPRQEGRVIPKVQSLLEARRDHVAQRRVARARLRALLVDDTASDDAILEALEGARRIEQEFRLKEERLRETIGSDLTPRQQGRFIFFKERFRRVMQRRLQEAAERGAPRRSGAPGRRPAGPSTEISPDDLEPEVEE